MTRLHLSKSDDSAQLPLVTVATIMHRIALATVFACQGPLDNGFKHSTYWTPCWGNFDNTVAAAWMC